LKISPFRAPYAPADEAIAANLLRGAALAPEREARVDETATRLIEAVRSEGGGIGGINDLLREYSLSTREGLALMVLAEALLRVPDAATADRLIEDKLGQGDFLHHKATSDAFLVNASAWALGLTALIVQPGETPESVFGQIVKRIGLPAVRAATRQLMRVMGSHFVLGETIENALSRAKEDERYRYSFDMLGEGARTAEDAQRYFESYRAAIAAIARAAGDGKLPDRPGISVKLSALHPRYEAISQPRVMAELVPKVIDLARAARESALNFTIDAEEADRLELSLDAIAAVASDPSLEGWEGFGLAIQAYQKRALPLIAWIEELAASLGRRFMVRLVKGAYWDSEVKRAQERGLADYPVFTRKAMTDLSFVACAERLLAARPRLYPQFATHNALTVASLLERAGETGGYEFQRLHGMGDALYGRLLGDRPGLACRTYAPVGGHRDLLAYLVRRLLENGANSSFVAASADPDVPLSDLLARPATIVGDATRARHPRIPLPRELYAPSRPNSSGIEFGDEADREGLLAKIAAAAGETRAVSLIGGKAVSGAERAIASPIDGVKVGTVSEAAPQLAKTAIAAAAAGFETWSRQPAAERAAALDKAGGLIEARRARFFWLLQNEGGKTLDDAIGEVREAVDFCRYYAAQARRDLAPLELPGPTGEANRLLLRGRGVFVAISPWNFPLSIFIGQIAAALVVGNAVVAKPAEQTPLIAYETIRLLHEAGIPATALQLVLGDGRIGAALVGDPRTSGVAFTGSTARAPRATRRLRR
jgi:RHH-type proline utilization regulon transcriptional repressor/proline dehydrogenase/delta 1-pyrroline-5-carboxylate dehydrogenase